MIENVCNSVRTRYIREKCVEIIAALIRPWLNTGICWLRLSEDAAQEA